MVADTKRWRLFQIGGHTIFMDATFLFLLAIFSFGSVNNTAQLLAGLLWIPVLFVSVLWHELGHAFATKVLGYGTSTIVLGGLGGVAIREGRAQSTPVHSLMISLAGPLASFLLAAMSGAILFAMTSGLTYKGYLSQLFYLFTVANIFWGVFNLLPIFPMDGGQAMRFGLIAALKRQRLPTQITAVVSLVTLVGALMLATQALRAGMFTILIGAYFAYLNWQLWKQAQQMRS